MTAQDGCWAGSDSHTKILKVSLLVQNNKPFKTNEIVSFD